MLPHFFFNSQLRPTSNYLLVLQKHNRLLTSCSILIQHLGDHGQKSIRQGAVLDAAFVCCGMESGGRILCF